MATAREVADAVSWALQEDTNLVDFDSAVSPDPEAHVTRYYYDDGSSVDVTVTQYGKADE